MTEDELSSLHNRYAVELPRRVDAVFRANPELYDHRSQFPWVLGCLGDPCAPIWFVAENPSLTQAERALESTPEDQWNVSPGDKLFRQQLVAHGLKTGTTDSPGGWRCYITDVIKGVVRVKDWNSLPETERQKVADAWAPVLAWEFELGRPTLIVSVGEKADRLLNHLLRRGLIPPLPQRMRSTTTATSARVPMHGPGSGRAIRTGSPPGASSSPKPAQHSPETHRPSRCRTRCRF